MNEIPNIHTRYNNPIYKQLVQKTSLGIKHNKTHNSQSHNKNKSFIYLPHLLERQKKSEQVEVEEQNKTIDFAPSVTYKPKPTTNTILVNIAQKASTIQITKRPNVYSTKASFQLLEMIKSDTALSHYQPYIDLVINCLYTAVYVQSNLKEIKDLPIFAQQEQYTEGIPYFKICNKVISQANNIALKMNNVKNDHNANCESLKLIISQKDQEISQLQSYLKQTNMKKQMESTIGKLEMIRVKNCESDDTIDNCLCNINTLQSELKETEENMLSVMREKAILLTKYNTECYEKEQLSVALQEKLEKLNRVVIENNDVKKSNLELIIKVDKLEKEIISLKQGLRKMVEIAHQLKLQAGCDYFDRCLEGINLEEVYS
jgi:hypothetical protein